VRQNGHGRRSFFNVVKTATILGDGNARIDDLAVAGLAAQLCHEFEDLDDSSGPDRVALGDETTRRIDRHFSTEPRSARFAERPTLTPSTQAEIFDLLNLGKRRGVMYLGHVDIRARDARLVISLERCAPSDVIRIVGDFAAHATRKAQSTYLDGA
jgi:hypothetical protein